jgi:hypothetical protein
MRRWRSRRGELSTYTVEKSPGAWLIASRMAASAALLEFVNL